MTWDVVFVGSGINSLVGAALLARGGRRVLVLERNDYLGGAIKTAEITQPGFVHDVFASWHPLFAGSAAYAELKDELNARGLEYLNTDHPTGSLFPDGSSAFLTASSRSSCRTPTSPLASSAPSSGRRRGFSSRSRPTAGSAAGAFSSSRAPCSPPAATGRPRPSRRLRRTGSSHPGSCTPASARTPPPPAS